jgi:hypothetical protein
MIKSKKKKKKKKNKAVNIIKDVLVLSRPISGFHGKQKEGLSSSSVQKNMIKSYSRESRWCSCFQRNKSLQYVNLCKSYGISDQVDVVVVLPSKR